MIDSVSSLLEELKQQELILMDKFDIKHPPTIGEMYEGLTSKLLKRAIPSMLDLKFVSGIIYDYSGSMTKQIDCMLVKGEGIIIPNTEKFKWHIKDVLVVIEVKKNLYSKDLEEAFENSRSVHESFRRCIQSKEVDFPFDEIAFKKSFSQTTKTGTPDLTKLDKLDFSIQMIYHTLKIEQISPIRIILGYHGFKSEYSFRNAMIKYLNKNLLKKGFGVGSFPQLIISDQYSLIKANGRPYTIPMQDDFWDFYVSSPTLPLKLLLELIWTKLANNYSLGGFWGEDLKMERMNKFISGRSIEFGEKAGWEYMCHPVNKKELEKSIDIPEWSPAFLDEAQFVIVYKLCTGHSEDINEPEFIKYLENNDWSKDKFIQSLLDTSLVAIKNDKFELITEECHCEILSTGEFVAAENNTGRLDRWIEKRDNKN